MVISSSLFGKRPTPAASRYDAVIAPPPRLPVGECYFNCLQIDYILSLLSDNHQSSSKPPLPFKRNRKMAPLDVFITTWNTGLQGSKAQSQDLTSWLLPVLHNASDPELPQGYIPDLYAVGIQELLPLHLARERFHLLHFTVCADI